MQEDDVNDSNFISKSTELITKQCKYLENNLSSNDIQSLDTNGLNITSQYFGKLHEDIDKLKVELAKCESQLSHKAALLKQRMSVDVNNYQKWTMNDIEVYLNGLENGRYSKYVVRMLSAFKNDGITGSNLPELDQGDLRQFGVENFKDRKDLRTHFGKLAAEQEGVSTHYH